MIDFLATWTVKILDGASWFGGCLCLFWVFYAQPEIDQEVAKELRKATCGCLCADTAPGAEGILKEPMFRRSLPPAKE